MISSTTCISTTQEALGVPASWRRDFECCSGSKEFPGFKHSVIKLWPSLIKGQLNSAVITYPHLCCTFHDLVNVSRHCLNLSSEFHHFHHSSEWSKCLTRLWWSSPSAGFLITSFSSFHITFTFLANQWPYFFSEWSKCLPRLWWSSPSAGFLITFFSLFHITFLRFETDKEKKWKCEKTRPSKQCKSLFLILIFVFFLV